MDKNYSIQEASQILRISKDTLRYYDRIGLLSPSRRDNRYRRYTRNDLIDLMNIQILQIANFTLEEVKGKVPIRRTEILDPTQCEEVATFLEAKEADIRRKMAHLELVCHLLHTAAEAIRDLNEESDHRLAETVREIYREILGPVPDILEEGCHEHQD